MTVTVHTAQGPRRWPLANDFLPDDAGRLNVLKTDDRGDVVVAFAVYAPGAWECAVNDDAVDVAMAQEADQ